MIDENGNLVDDSGQPIDENGNPIDPDIQAQLDQLAGQQQNDANNSAALSGPLSSNPFLAANSPSSVDPTGAFQFIPPTPGPGSSSQPIGTGGVSAPTVLPAGSSPNHPLSAVSSGGGNGNSPGAASLDDQISKLIQALNSTNEQDFAEKVREFNVTHDQAVADFQEKASEFAQDLGFRKDQLANQLGFDYTKLATDNANTQKTIGLDALKLAGSLQADPFRQQEVEYGLSQGGYSPAIDAIAGRTPGMTQFQAPNGSAAGTASLGFLSDKVASLANPLTPQQMVDQFGQAVGQPGAAAMPSTGGAALGATGFPGVSFQFSDAAKSASPSPAITAAGGLAAPGQYGASSAPVFHAPGPNSPNDTAQGTLMAGTTGMMQGATQNFGIGPGQGSNSVSGTRGTNIVGFNKDGLVFDSQFLQPKSKAVFNLWDETTNQNVADNSAVLGAIKGTGSGWSGAYYVPGGNGRYTFGGVTPGSLDPTHQYSIRVALPDEGGGVGNEAHVAGSTIVGLPNLDQQIAAQSQPAPAPAPTPSPAFTAPTAAPAAANPLNAAAAAGSVSTGGAASNPAMTGYYNALNALPNPNQVVARNFFASDPATQNFVVSGLKAKTGLDADTINHQIKSTLPSFAAPAFGDVQLS